jgi:hypothetical protein
MSLVCPKCGSRNLRYSRLRTFSERCGSWFGVRPLRCRECYLRFIERTWRLSSMKYARCPRCWRMDLSRWSTKDYYTKFLTRLLLRLGANPYRCEYCRVNFISFRKRKERYDPHHRKHRRHRSGRETATKARAPET